MDHLAPTIANKELLALLGKVLETDPTPESTTELRLRFFEPGFSWQSLVDLAVAHEVLPPLIFSLNRRSLLPPVPYCLSEGTRNAHVTTRLAAAYREHLERQASLREQLQTALAALNAKGIVPLLLKGAVHLTMGEKGWHETRAMRDLDMLVSANDAGEANRILSSLGYRPDPDPPPVDRHLPELWSPGSAGTIEIHTEALAFNARGSLRTDEIWRRSVERSFGSTTCRVLRPEWHLLHGLLHHQLADRGHARRMLALKGLWEFSRVGNEVPPQGWHAVVEHARARGILDVLSSWSIQANRLFGLDAPSELMTLQAGRKHTDATFRRACAPLRLRRALFVADRLRFAFAPETLAVRYGEFGNGGSAALRHVAFLWRRRRHMARR